MKTKVRPLEGRHRDLPTWYYVLVLVPLGFVAGAPFQLLESRWLGLLVGLVLFGVLNGVLFVLVRAWGPQTEVRPRGLRIQQGPRRQRDLEWDDVVAVEMRSEWDGGLPTRVRLENGAAVGLPGMPSGRWAGELEAYWQAHRHSGNRTTSPDDPTDAS